MLDALWLALILCSYCCSGIGSALCERLLQEDASLHLCLACRNLEKANATRNHLLSCFPSADVSIVQIDVSKVASVLRAAEEIKARYVGGAGTVWLGCLCCGSSPGSCFLNSSPFQDLLFLLELDLF